MTTAADLKHQTKGELATLAKRLGIPAYMSMRKEELITAVVAASNSAGKTKKSKSTSIATKPSKTSAKKAKAPSAKSQVASKKSGVQPAGSKSMGKAPAKTMRGPDSKAKPVRSSKSDGDSKVSSAKPKTVKQPKSEVKLAKTDSRLRSQDSEKPTKTKTDLASETRLKSEPTLKSRRSSAKSQAEMSPKTKRNSTTGLPATTATENSESLKVKKSSRTHDRSRPDAAKEQSVGSQTDPQILKKIRELQLQRQSDQDIAFRPTLVRPPGAAEPVWESEPQQDRVALFVRDAYWMHASWDITRSAIDRAKSAMLEHWHGAKPILRLLRLDDTGTTSTSETVERDLPIHGGTRNSYIEWNGTAASFRVLIGYLASNGRFHIIAKSNIVKTPAAGSADVVDEHWMDMGAESERIFAMSGGYDAEMETGELKEMLEQRLHRTLGAPALAKLGAGAESPFRRRGGFHFDMDVELVVYGSTVPDGYLTLNGEPVALRSDGTFLLRVPFPDRRQVLPAVACSRDGSQQRTIVVAVERNTKVMEPLEAEQDTGE